MSFLYQEESYLFFSLAPGIGPKRFNELLNAFASAEGAYRANESDLARCLGSSVAHQLISFRGSFKPYAVIDSYRKKGVSLLTRENPLYPSRLKEIDEAPICLYCLSKNGEPLLLPDDTYFAIVGSRNHTSYGKYVADTFAAELASGGFNIVSGLALGIDALAHAGALSVNGRTTAVLGCGVDISYPPANNKLREKILEAGNCILSEYAPGTQPSRGTFVARNRIVSGMCRGVLIVEGAEKSGTLITAMFAANQGRDVFAVPGQINSPLAQAPLILLRQGAQIVSKPQDIFEEYGLHLKNNTSKMKLNLNENQQKIYDVLRYEPLYIDDIVHLSGISVAQTTSILSLMEIEGCIQKDYQGKYSILVEHGQQ